ncbi:hypothetical protein ACOSQ4_012452 [Xanthoceras sorbifolium]
MFLLTLLWVWFGLRRHCKNPKGGTNRRNFEVASTSASATKRKLNPLIENVPLFNSQQRTHHTRSISNPCIIHNIYMFSI